MTKSDKKILKFFFILLTILFPLGIIINLYLQVNIGQIILSLYFILLGIFLVTGILVFYYNHKCEIISTKKIFKWFAIISAISAPFFTAILFSYILSEGNDPNIYLWSSASYMVLIGLYIGMFIAVFLSFIIFIFLSFGMIGILTALERGMITEILHHISNITSTLSDSLKKKEKQKFLVYYFLRWIFIIPDVLNTKTLNIKYRGKEKKFPWSNLKKAMMWQLLLGIIVIIYISLNPFFLESISFQSLFSIASNISLFIPIIILPWFIFLRIDARIKGPAKDFQLYSGIAYRMYRTFVTLGTIIIIIRLALKNVNLREVIMAIPIYYVFFIITVFFLTFVYFNYFENNLASDVSEGFVKIKD